MSKTAAKPSAEAVHKPTMSESLREPTDVLESVVIPKRLADLDKEDNEARQR